MNALVLVTAHWFGIVGKRQVPVHSHRLLCAELD